MVLLYTMKTSNFRIQRSGEEVNLADFVKFYNEDLPSGYPHASVKFLLEFKDSHPKLFKDSNMWSLVKHRKQLMDWLPRYIRLST